MSKERIVCAANKVFVKEWEDTPKECLNRIYAGIRHGYCFGEMKEAQETYCELLLLWCDRVAVRDELRIAMVNNTTQGFLTNLNRFVDRKEALEIAKSAEQIIHKHNPQDELLSEDLY